MAEKAESKAACDVRRTPPRLSVEQEALRRVLVQKGLLTNDEVLEEVKAVRREMEGKRGR